MQSLLNVCWFSRCGRCRQLFHSMKINIIEKLIMCLRLQKKSKNKLHFFRLSAQANKGTKDIINQKDRLRELYLLNECILKFSFWKYHVLGGPTCRRSLTPWPLRLPNQDIWKLYVHLWKFYPKKTCNLKLFTPQNGPVWASSEAQQLINYRYLPSFFVGLYNIFIWKPC